MRIYSRRGAVAIDDPEYGRFEAEPDGGFDLPDDLSDKLVRFHQRGIPLWETEIDRGQRVTSEDLERRRDPANLLDAVQQILSAAQLATAMTAQAKAPAPAVEVPAEAKAPRGRGPKRTPAEATASEQTVPGQGSEPVE